MTVEPQSTEAEAEAESRLEAELEAELHAEAEEAGSSGDDVLGGSSEEGGRASGARKQGVETPPVTFRSLTELRQQLQSAKGTRPVGPGARAAAGGAGAGAGARGVAGWGAAAGAGPAARAGPPAATAARPTAPAAAAAAAPSRPQAVRPLPPPPASSTASSAPPRRSNSPLRKPVTSFPSPSSLSLGPAPTTSTSSSTQPQPRAVTPPRASIFSTARPAPGTGTPAGSWAPAPSPDIGSRTPAVSAGLTSASRGFLSEDEEYDLFGMDDDDVSRLTDDDDDGPLRFDSLAPRPIPGALSAAEYAELERDPAYAKAKAYAMSVVQRTAVSCAELALKLQARGAAPEHASALVGWLTAQGLLNDALFAQLFVQSKWTSKLLAPAKIKHELLSAKSVAPSAVDAALAAVFGPSRSIRLTGPASRQETEVREALVAAARKHVERGRSSKLKAPAAGSQAANAAALAQAKAKERDSQRRRLATWLMYRGHSVDMVTAMIRVLGL
ncbi:hypothetical protein HYH03_007111 [Edaphochlamys debaryana]|uniref:Regulatory protein RecX n=1 Tax=Edaphochlamys debaryana TaxID=47281 RepID=A0A835Y468_9CHLO|nr:hypothetical protein HYH03_007111 [Edaphochlamys debaryana]|eukprot:KAG2494872.1 hypothetical protein HYH03_007111 [Edaphochlamys debaryana]